jgi:PadR family transcriptional regulator, regulatory protein PadR
MCGTQYASHGMSEAMPLEEDLFEKLRVELRRGSLILAVLGALREERYGYTLRQTLEDAGLPIEEGALYPLLRRLETQGLLTSEWREDANRNKRFYKLSRDGKTLLTQLLTEWEEITASIHKLNGRRS